MRRKPVTLFLDAIILTFGSLLPIMNPFSTAPLFASLTASFSREKQRKQAILACVYAFAILATFLLLGSWIVEFFGISVPGIRVAGGLIISTVGFRMLFPPKPTTGGGEDSAEIRDIAFTPIAMPSLAGPGSIAVVLSSAAHIQSRWSESSGLIFAGVLVGLALTLVFSFVILRASSRMVAFMGDSGIDAMTRIFGFLLICVAMQFLLTGIADFYNIDVGAGRSRHAS